MSQEYVLPFGFFGPAIPLCDAESTTTTTATGESNLGPKKVTVDGQTVEQHSLKDLIEADRYCRAQANASSLTAGIRFGKVNNGAAVKR